MSRHFLNGSQYSQTWRRGRFLSVRSSENTKITVFHEIHGKSWNSLKRLLYCGFWDTDLWIKHGFTDKPGTPLKLRGFKHGYLTKNTDIWLKTWKTRKFPVLTKSGNIPLFPASKWLFCPTPLMTTTVTTTDTANDHNCDHQWHHHCHHHCVRNSLRP